MTNSDKKIKTFKTLHAYNAGLNDAWELAKKIIGEPNLFGSSDDSIELNREKIFGEQSLYQIFKKFTAPQALKAVSAFEEGRKNFSVGDEVISLFDNRSVCIVTHVDTSGKRIEGIDEEGKIRTYATEYLQKTGKEYPEIASVLTVLKKRLK